MSGTSLTSKTKQNFHCENFNFKQGARFTYQYDFCDSWNHTLVVENILPIEKGMALPQCIKGVRACPPEDVGGPWGYSDFLEAIKDPHHEEHVRYLEWIGGEFDPDAFDLEGVNNRLRQRSKPNWSESPSFTIISIDSIEPTRLARLLTPENADAAQRLPLRQDVITFLNYLKANKVTGTSSTGNLPRKAIEGVTPLFVNPPPLGTKIHDMFFGYRTEDDIWPLYFIHVLAHATGLISGGQGRRWKLTPSGENFLTIPAINQVWNLFYTWWHRVNWMIAYPYNFLVDDLPGDFTQAAIFFLSNLPVDQPQIFEPFADQLIKAMGWMYLDSDSDEILNDFREVIQFILINPLEDFGILSTTREKVNDHFPGKKVLRKFTLAGFGYAMLEAVRG